VPLRQWVLTLPIELSGRLGFDGKPLGAVARLFVDSVLGWYWRHLRTSTRAPAESGAVVVVQRSSSDLKLNAHLHVVFLMASTSPRLSRFELGLGLELGIRDDASPEMRALAARIRSLCA
jgi:hypothetical protein